MFLIIRFNRQKIILLNCSKSVQMLNLDFCTYHAPVTNSSMLLIAWYRNSLS